jgi:hypothetical protein
MVVNVGDIMTSKKERNKTLDSFPFMKLLIRELRIECWM